MSIWFILQSTARGPLRIMLHKIPIQDNGWNFNLWHSESRLMGLLWINGRLSTTSWRLKSPSRLDAGQPQPAKQPTHHYNARWFGDEELLCCLFVPSPTNNHVKMSRLSKRIDTNINMCTTYHRKKKSTVFSWQRMKHKSSPPPTTIHTDIFNKDVFFCTWGKLS